jgi:hypothetical protein
MEDEVRLRGRFGSRRGYISKALQPPPDIFKAVTDYSATEVVGREFSRSGSSSDGFWMTTDDPRNFAPIEELLVVCCGLHHRCAWYY